MVGHDPADQEARGLPEQLRPFMFTAAQVAALLDPARWEILVAESRSREGILPDGDHATVRDAVLMARRRG